MDLYVDSVTRSDLEDFVYDDSVADATRNQRFRHLRAFFNWCEGQGFANGTPDLDEPETYDTLPKVVRREELEAVCDTIREDHRRKAKDGLTCNENDLIWRIPVFRFAFFTGFRASEIGRLRWKHVRLRREEVEVVKQKNREAQVLHLSEKALEVLRGLDHREGWVFCGPLTDPLGDRSVLSFQHDVSNHWRQYRRKAGIERPISFHGLRHGFVSYLAEQGVNAHTIKRLARHKTMQTTQKYVHLSQDGLKDALDDAFND